MREAYDPVSCHLLRAWSELRHPHEYVNISDPVEAYRLALFGDTLPDHCLWFVAAIPDLAIMAGAPLEPYTRLMPLPWPESES